MPLLKNGCASYGVNVIVKQSYQPTMQGAETNPTLYFFKIADKRIGHPERKSTWNALTSKFSDADVQRMETTFQVSGLVRQVPQTTTTSLTASDVLNVASMVMQSRETIDALVSHNIGILRITEIRNPYFKDDRDQFQSSPSFDFTIVHNQSIIRLGKAVEAFEYNIKGV